MLPIKIHNRLLLGRVVSAEVPARNTEHRAWIHVIPKIDATKATWDRSGRTVEPVLIRNRAADDPICGFTIRYREIHRRFEEWPDDWDHVGLTVDETFHADDVSRLVEVLSQWADDLAIFRHPFDDGSPF